MGPGRVKILGQCTVPSSHPFKKICKVMAVSEIFEKSKFLQDDDEKEGAMSISPFSPKK